MNYFFQVHEEEVFLSVDGILSSFSSYEILHLRILNIKKNFNRSVEKKSFKKKAWAESSVLIKIPNLIFSVHFIQKISLLYVHYIAIV